MFLLVEIIGSSNLNAICVYVCMYSVCAYMCVYCASGIYINNMLHCLLTRTNPRGRVFTSSYLVYRWTEINKLRCSNYSQADALNFELLELVNRMNSTQLPPIPDIEEVHFSIDKCQVSTILLCICN